MSKKAKAMDRAKPTIHAVTHTDAEKVSVARTATAAAKNGPAWATAPDLQAAAKLWSKVSDDMEANATVISGLRSQLAAAEGKQLSLRRSWGAARRQVLSTVDVLCAGSADDVKANGFDALTRTNSGAPIAPPDTVHTEPGKAPGSVKVSWLKGSGRHGFVLQHATDVSNTATYSALIPVTGTKYTLQGAISGSVVHFRVAAIDPSEAAGCTAFSAWASGTAR
jgi:hypothetical protein